MGLMELDDKDLLLKVVKDFEKASNSSYRTQYIKQCEENYRLYRSKLKEKRDGANLFIPYTWSTVEQLKARGIQALFSKSPYVSFAGVGTDDVDGAKLMEELVYYQMKEKLNLPYKFTLALNSIFIFGMAIALYQWKYEERAIKRRQDIIDFISGIKTGEQVIEQMITAYDDPDVEFIPVDDFYWDPEGWDKKTCSFFATRVDRDIDYLKQKEKEGIYKLPDITEGDSGDIIANFRDSVNGTSGSEFDRNKKHELISYYTDDVKIVVLNRKYIIQKEENQLYCKEKPFIKMVAFPLEKEFAGMSIVQILQSLQEELNTTRNQRIDNVSLVLNKIFGYNRNADIDPNTIKSKAGHCIPMDSKDDVWDMPVPDITQSAYNEEQIIKQDMQFVSGVSEYARGATPQRKETATTVTTIQEASNIVFNYVTSMIETSGLIPLADAMKKLNQQYVTEARIIRLLDAATGQWNYPEINPNSIQGSFDVVSTSPRLETQQTKEAKRIQMLEMFNTFINNPATAGLVNVQEFMKKIMDTYDIKDYEKLLQQPQVIQPQQNINPLQEMGASNGY